MAPRDFERRIERRHLELFLEKQKYFAATNLNPCFRDEPDLLIEFDGMTIGIEHTRYFPPHSRKGQEELQNEVVWKAWQFFQETSSLSERTNEVGHEHDD